MRRVARVTILLPTVIMSASAKERQIQTLQKQLDDLRRTNESNKLEYEARLTNLQDLVKAKRATNDSYRQEIEKLNHGLQRRYVDLQRMLYIYTSQPR